MEVTSFYNRVIYRDFLGYILPGSILVASVITVFSPIEIRGRVINPLEDFSATQLIVTLGLGFVFGHLIAVIPRTLLRKEKRWRALSIRSFESYRIKAVEPVLKKGFESAFGKNSWNELDLVQKKELILRYVSANDLADNDMLHRIESLRIFFENAIFILTLSMLILATNVSIMSLSRTTSALLLGSIGISVALLSFWGLRSTENLQDREMVLTFVDHYIKTRKDTPIEGCSA